MDKLPPGTHACDLKLDFFELIGKPLEQAGKKVLMVPSREYAYKDADGAEQKVYTTPFEFSESVVPGAGDALIEKILKLMPEGTNTIVVHGGRIDGARGPALEPDVIYVQMYMGFIDHPEYRDFGKEETQYLEDYAMSGENVDLGVVMRALRYGYRCRRQSWNDTTFIYLVPSSSFQVARTPLLGIYPEGTQIDFQEHIDICTGGNQCAVWPAPQADLLAADWIVCLKGA